MHTTPAPARTSQAISPAVLAPETLWRLAVGFTFAALGVIALTLADELPGWLDLPLRALTHAPQASSQPPLAGAIATLVALALGAAFACFAVALRADPPAWARRAAHWLILPLLLWSCIASAQSVGVLARGIGASATEWPPRYTSDEMYYNQYAALLTFHGVNPYRDANDRLLQALAYFHIRGYTPIARGVFSDPTHIPTGNEMKAALRAYQAHPQTPPPEIDPATFHSYPAGAFLVDIPFVWLGIPGMGLAQILLSLALVATLAVRAAPTARLPVALLALSSPALAQRIATGDFDIWWIAALALAWAWRDHRIRSALALGVACAIKQTAWLAAPFYLIWAWRSYGPREALRRAVFAGAAFLAVNLPFLITAPGDWAHSLLLPVSLPLLPEGSGLIGLSLSGALPLGPSHLYAALEAIALLAALAWWAWPRARAITRYPLAGIILPLLPLFFAWRSASRYFLPLALLAAIAVALSLRSQAPVHDRAV